MELKNKKLRILQLIDSLETGGAERMAVNYANALLNFDQVELSALVVTRKEGGLKNQLDAKVDYLFLKKIHTIDFGAILRFVRFIKNNNISHIQAHSTSFFLAFITKLICPKLVLIWHDHYGNSEFLNNRKSFLLKFASTVFNYTIVVNYKLQEWNKKNLFCKKVKYLPNFVQFTPNLNSETILKGVNGKRIICLANLREQKNHLFLLELALRLKNDFNEWTFHLVGKDFEDEYSKKIKEEIVSKGLTENVFIYGSKNDVPNILKQASVGILTSKSEGLPVSVLEYGYYKLPVISTNVGQISQVLNDFYNGIVVDNNNLDDFTKKIRLLLSDLELQKKLGDNLHDTVIKEYTEYGIISSYLAFIQE